MKTNEIDQSGATPPLEIVEPAIDRDGSPPLLADYLQMLPPGPIQNTAPVTRLLAAVWENLEGSDQGGMKGYKLHDGRCENLTWSPPVLSFVIARHGAMAFGSSRAELQYWVVDPFKGEAGISGKGKRQVYPNDERLDTDSLAEGVATEIESGSESNHLKWYPDGSVKVFVGQIIPTTFKQTTANRRERFRYALIAAMDSKGWEEIKVHTYKKVSEP